MGFELVILDCDGVLVDSEPISNRVFTRALNEAGLPVSYEQVRDEFTGLTLTSCLEIVERRLGRRLPRGFVDDLQRRTFEALRSGLREVRGVTAALDRIDRPLCVASSGKPEKVRFTLGLTGLLPRFEGRLFTAGEVSRGKPHPEPYLKSLKDLSIKANQAVVIENAPFGIRSAKGAGIQCLALQTSLPKSYLLEADAIYSSISQLQSSVSFVN